MPKLAKPITGDKSKRVSLDELATRLRKTRDVVAEMLDGGLFTVIQDQPGKQGSPRFVPESEAEYAELNGVDALQAYRRRTKRRSKAS